MFICLPSGQTVWILLLKSKVKNYINTVQFLAQTNGFVSLLINVSSRATVFNLVLYVYVSGLPKP